MWIMEFEFEILHISHKFLLSIFNNYYGFNSTELRHKTFEHTYM